MDERDEVLSMAELGQQVYGLPHRLVRDPSRWVSVIEDDRKRYIQVLAPADGSLFAEIAALQLASLLICNFVVAV